MMAKKKSERFGLIEKLAKQKEQKAVEFLSKSQIQLQQETDKLQELINYQAQYQADLVEQGKKGMSSQTWQSQQYFLDQLEDVVSQQQQQVNHCAQNVENVKEKWKELHLKSQSIGKLKVKVQNQELMVEEKKEQKNIDELSARAFINMNK